MMRKLLNFKNDEYRYRYLSSNFLRFVLFCCLNLSLAYGGIYAQTTIIGTVTDDSDVPLPGVSVQEQGTDNGVVTDFDGNYTIDVGSEDATLIFSFVGMEAVERTATPGEPLNVQMQSSTEALDEVVLVGYGTQERKAVTTAVSKVSAEEFNQGVVTSPLELIQGKVAGLQITRAGGNDPNSGTAIQLRGITSLSGSTSPLIVIDGIPGGNLDLIQQNDIASFDVLKDGAAAAIYGTRGTNGVILITTKKGQKGVTKFNYSTYLAKDFANSKPNFLNADQFRSVIESNGLNANLDLGANTNIFDKLINDSNLSQYHNFVASGGGENSNYRTSFYYRDLEGIGVENSRSEFGVRANFNQSAFDDKLQFQSSIATNFNNANLLGGNTTYNLQNQALAGNPFGIVADWNPTAPIYAPYNTSQEGLLNNPGEYGFYQPANGYNPFSEFANRFYERDQQTFSGDIKLSYTFVEGLSASVFGSFQQDRWNDRFYRSTEDFAQYGPNSNYNGTAYAYKGNYIDYTKTIEPTLNWNKVFDKHNFELLAGYSYQYSTNERYSMSNSGFTTDGFQDWNFGAGNAITDTDLPRPSLYSFKEDNTLIAYFTRLSYNFNERYFLQASIRHEGSSRFGANNKWANFPAISGGWLISEEDFMDNINFLTNLKIRLGYGETGNQGIPNYQSIVTLGTGGKYPIFRDEDSQPTYYQTYGPNRNPNPDLRWETKKEFNLGIEFGLFSNRLTGTLDLYSRKTEDLLLNYNVPQPPFVQPNIYTNVGTIKNEGIELAFTYRVLNIGDFSWTADFAGSYQRNDLTTLSNQVFSINELFGGNIGNPGNLGNAIRNTEGGPIGDFYGKRFAGFTRDGQWLFYKEDGTIGRTSEMVEEDKSIIGNGLPKYYASLTNTFRYKNFDLTILLRGKFDYDILNTVDLFYGNPTLLPGNVLTSAVGKYSEISEAPQYSDYYLENGDFVKLDNLTLGYNFQMSEDSPFTGVRIYGSARNLALFTGYTGRDPEVQDTGLYPGIDDRNFYPRTITTTLGINVNF